MPDEIWNARHKKLKTELKEAVKRYTAHTGRPGFKIALDDGRVIFCGLLMKTAEEETTK